MHKTKPTPQLPIIIATAIMHPSRYLLRQIPMPPRPRNLLICFDAFGTLFTPKAPIEQQYGDVARGLGLAGFSDGELKRAFREGESTTYARN